MVVVPSPIDERDPRGPEPRYDVVGDGPTVVCLPGGPLLPPDYLGGLGGLARDVRLVRLLPPDGEDAAACRCDRVAESVDALRTHLGIDRITVLAHSAGASAALRFAELHPDGVARLVLVTPSLRALGMVADEAARADLAAARAGEPWHPAAAAALRRLSAGDATEDDRLAVVPFTYGRWDAAAQSHDALIRSQRDPAAAERFAAEGAFDPGATRAALSDATVPIDVIGGEVDPIAPPSLLDELRGIVPVRSLRVQRGAGHFPWVDDPAVFSALAREALGEV